MGKVKLKIHYIWTIQSFLFKGFNKGRIYKALAASSTKIPTMNATTATEEKDDQEENFVHKYTHLNGISIPNPSGMFGRQLRKEFLFDENYINMNHGT